MQRVSGVGQGGSNLGVRVVEAKRVTVDAGTQTTAVQGMRVQTESKRMQEHTEENLCAFVIKCIMLLHTESKKTES